MTEVPAGWYPDPSGLPEQLRWWDGTGWTDDLVPEGAFAGDEATLESEPAPAWDPTPRDIDWEPQAEPPPWDDEHGPPVADWESEPFPSPWESAPEPVEPPTVEFGASQAPPQQAPPQPSWEPLPQAQEPEPEPRRRRAWLVYGGIAAGLAVILLLGVVGGYAWLNRGDNPIAGPSNSPSTSPSGSSPAPQKGPKVKAGGISYVRLGSAWGKPSTTGINELAPNKGQAQVTQANAPGVRGDWVAQVTVGRLAKKFTYGGPDDLEKTTAEFAESVAASYYDPLKTSREDTDKKSLELSGRDAYQMEFHLTFSNPPKGFTAKGETVHVVVIDAEPRPVGAYITIPDDKPELRPTADQVIRGLRVAP